MDLLTPDLRAALIRNAEITARDHASETGSAHDPAPVVKFFNPCGAATWLATELDPDGDTLFGLADLGFGCPELGSFSLAEIAALRLPFGLGIERDLGFASGAPLSKWADLARRAGSIIGAEAILRRNARRAAPDDPSDPPPSDGSDAMPRTASTGDWTSERKSPEQAPPDETPPD